MQGPRLIDQSLRQRAARVVPGGMWGHLHASKLPAGYPQFFDRADGCRLWDVDGRPYLDFMCSWGPIVLGHHDPDVEAAVSRQQSLGDCMNGPSPRMVELAELMVETVPHADWAMFAKNGTDATTLCLMIARAASGKRKILVARGAYHGSAPWCTPIVLGTTPEDRANTFHFTFNDIGSLEEAASAANGDVAGILVSAFRHDYGINQEMPDPRFAARARALADEVGAALILDDVRAGFRLHMGGSWELVGVRPDLSAWSKAMGNGYPISAVLGNDSFRDAASRLFVTGSFWCGASAMAAAIATIEKLAATNSIARMSQMGHKLRAGLDDLALRHGLALRQSGPEQMPLILFEGADGLEKGRRFCQAMLRRGVYMHPSHNMFLSAAHGLEEIDEALAAADKAFQDVAQDFSTSPPP